VLPCLAFNRPEAGVLYVGGFVGWVFFSPSKRRGWAGYTATSGQRRD